MKKISVLLLGLFLLNACSTELKYKMSNHKFLTPETKGQFLKGDVGLAYQENQKVVLATAYDYLIFNSQALNTSSSMSRTGELDVPITLGLLSRLDFFTLDSKYGMKFQFLGGPENERKHGWKAAIALAYGAEHDDAGSVTYSGQSSVRSYTTDIKVKNYDVNLILGNRISENFLFYLSLMRDYYQYKGALTSTQFSAINVSGHSVNYGALLGGHLTEANSKHPFFIKIETGVVDGKLDKRDSRTAGTFGGEVGWSW